ncbi:MAG TPA: VOC family protein [Ignavibacteria bacterium]|nr:VOC family protein [Ignavibacteria bacterium]
MITKLSHSTIYVTDQDAAKDFYVNTLGFELKHDFPMENNFRWLTVSPKGQDIELILLPVDNSFISKENAEKIKQLSGDGVFGPGAFVTNNCKATYEELKAKGVKFKGEPKEQFYGTEMVMQDPFGNWFSVVEPKEMK